jgi:hypothetical protein
MNVSSNRYKPLLGGLVALAVAGAATPVLAATQGQADTSSAPVIATEQPAAAGTGANPGDLARTEMQANPQAFPLSMPSMPYGQSHAATEQHGSSAPVIATDEPAAPGTGANPGDLARAEMQARPEPFPLPWHG